MDFKSGTVFTDSEFVKNCVLDVSEDMCSETSAPLSETVYAWRVR